MQLPVTGRCIFFIFYYKIFSITGTLFKLELFIFVITINLTLTNKEKAHEIHYLSKQRTRLRHPISKYWNPFL